MSQYDIAIAGCGIAGLTSAILLARQGHNVTMYERFESPQALGSGLMIQPTGLAVLTELGLAEDVCRRGACVTGLLGVNRNGERVLNARYADLPIAEAFGLGIHRASLFEVLYNAAAASGTAFRTGGAVSRSELSAAGRRLIFADGRRCDPHDLVIDCLGLSSPLSNPPATALPYGALWTTLDWPDDGPFDPSLLEQRYDAAHRMVGVLPTGLRKLAGTRELSLFWSLRAQDFAVWRAEGLVPWKAELCRLWPDCETLLDQIGDAAQMVFARYAHRTLRQPVSERMIHIGDAWHSASPQLGQGANMALLDAWAVARALSHDLPLQEALGTVVALRQRHVRLYQRLTALFTPLYQSHAQWPALLRDMVLAPLSRMGPAPQIQALLVGGLVGSPLERLGLAMPDYAALASTSSIALRASSLDQS